MPDWKDVAHFLYGRGFWYADPLREIEGLTEEQLYWQPDSKAYCVLWHVGHIAHRERLHIGRFLQGLQRPIVPPQYDIFGTRWCTPAELREEAGSPEAVFEWVRQVREESHAFIASLAPGDWHVVRPTSEFDLSVSQWLFITTAHTALHIGRIQLLRGLIEGHNERAC